MGRNNAKKPSLDKQKETSHHLYNLWLLLMKPEVSSEVKEQKRDQSLHFPAYTESANILQMFLLKGTFLPVGKNSIC